MVDRMVGLWDNLLVVASVRSEAAWLAMTLVMSRAVERAALSVALLVVR